MTRFVVAMEWIVVFIAPSQDSEHFSFEVSSLSYGARSGHGYGNCQRRKLRRLITGNKSAVKDEQAGAMDYAKLAREAKGVGLPKVSRIFLSHARDEKRHKREDVAALKKVKSVAKKA
jgi:hypothetical protein